jgi:cyclohexanone monooxygenase
MMDQLAENRTSTTKQTCDVVIVGAGFAGLFMLHRLRALGYSVRVIEQADDVGGTWYWNRYPGARCDVESMQYSYSFDEALQQDWKWTERFATQPEILRYINHVADRFDLRRNIQFGIRMNSATFDEANSRWRIETSAGEIDARFCIMATGCLSAAKTPEFAGLEDFKGNIYYTSHWPHEPVNFAGQRVGVIGTGSSGIQAIPEIAKQAKHLTVFQRTPNYSVPARNASLTPEQEQHWKSRYSEHRQYARTTPSGTIHDFGQRSALDATAAERQQEYEARWQQGGPGFTRTFNDITRNVESNRTAAEFVRSKIGEIVRDSQTRDILTPKDFPLGAKRICVDSGYFETFNRDNVELVDLRSTPIDHLTDKGLQTTQDHFAFDSIVFATGFDAMTGPLLRVEINGRGQGSLRDKWAAGPRTYLGLMTADFPNLFMITGPGSPSVLSNVIVSIEQHVNWIADLLAHAREQDIRLIEVDLAAEDAWVDRVNEAASKTLFLLANSWYLGANVPGKPRVFMPFPGGVGTYRTICDDVAARGYEGFRLEKQRQVSAA